MNGSVHGCELSIIDKGMKTRPIWAKTKVARGFRANNNELPYGIDILLIFNQIDGVSLLRLDTIFWVVFRNRSNQCI